MAFSVTITYKGVEADPAIAVAPISGVYCPRNSYIDSAVYENGYPVDVEITDKTKVGYDQEKKYGKSIYATNVDDKFGYAAQVEPYASESIPFPVPLAQFKMAVVGGTDGSYKFDVEDYKEAFYYMELGKELAPQFEVVVEKK